MTRKQWAALTLSLLALGIGGTIAAVSIIDPFEVYHKATAFIPPITNGTQLYSNAGIAKNYAYDSVVIGSSMTENFRPSQLNRLFGGQFVKLCVNGGSSYEPLIASLAIDCGVKVNILGADTRNIEGKAFGTMLLGLPKEPEEAAKALRYIQSQPDITVEEVTGYA